MYIYIYIYIYIWTNNGSQYSIFPLCRLPRSHIKHLGSESKHSTLTFVLGLKYSICSGSETVITKENGISVASSNSGGGCIKKERKKERKK